MSYNDDRLYNAIKKTIRTISGMSDYCLDLQHITADDIHTLLDSVINTDFYCLKEIKVNRRIRMFYQNIIYAFYPQMFVFSA